MALVDFIQWNSSDLPVRILVNCFLPTGVLVPLQSTVNTSLVEIKAKLFFEARDYPLYKRLQSPLNYCFVCINQKGKREELEDERLCLRDVRPFRPFLKLVERQGNPDKEIIDSKSKFLLGKTPKEFDDTNDVQIGTFRPKYQSIAYKVCSERRQMEWDGRSMCSFPPDLYDDENPPKRILDKLVDGQFFLTLYIPPAFGVHGFNIPGKCSPTDILVKALQKKASLFKQAVEEHRNYTLKVKGKQAYLLGNYPLLQYKVVFLIHGYLFVLVYVKRGRISPQIKIPFYVETLFCYVKYGISQIV